MNREDERKDRKRALQIQEQLSDSIQHLVSAMAAAKRQKLAAEAKDRELKELKNKVSSHQHL